MPIYEYFCRKCKSEFELLVRSSDTPKCPECGAVNLERQMSVPAAAHSSEPGCPGANEMCAQQPMSCCGSRGCRCS